MIYVGSVRRRVDSMCQHQQVAASNTHLRATEQTKKGAISEKRLQQHLSVLPAPHDKTTKQAQTFLPVTSHLPSFAYRKRLQRCVNIMCQHHQVAASNTHLPAPEQTKKGAISEKRLKQHLSVLPAPHGKKKKKQQQTFLPATPHLPSSAYRQRLTTFNNIM